MKNPTVLQMLNVLSNSDNLHTKTIASRILIGYETIEQAKQRGYGGFLDAVLNGDYLTACARADQSDLKQLEKL